MVINDVVPSILKLGIVIVNYRTAALTLACLDSLNSVSSHYKFSVIVIDNNSHDDSYEYLCKVIGQRNWHSWVKIIASDINGGFSHGNNIAIKQFLAIDNPPEFICLLNPDTYIHTGAMDTLINFLVGNPQVGIAGSRLEDPDGTGQMSSFKFHDWITELDRGFNLGVLTKILKPWLGEERIPENNTQTDWVAGASMMIRTSVFNDIGLLDESYFMYYEEMDFCLQAARANWQCWYVPASRVVHYVGQSSGVTDKKLKAKRRPQYWFNSRRRYFLKNYGIVRACIADIARLTGLSVWRLRNIFQKKSHNFPPYFWYDSLNNSVFIKGARLSPTKNKIGES